MRDLNLFSSSALSTLVRVVALATLTLLSLAIGSLLLKTSRWRTWLRDLPGPQRKSWFLGNWADFGNHDVIDLCLDWTRQYGGAVRIWAPLGEPRLLLMDPVAIHHVLVDRAYDYPKQRDAARVLRSLMGPGLLVAEGDQHKRQKRALQPGFAPSSIKALLPIFQRDARELRDRLLVQVDQADNDKSADGAGAGERADEQGNGKSIIIDMLRPVSRATLDILGHAGFGIDFNALKEEDLSLYTLPASSRSGASASASHSDAVSSNPLASAFDKVLSLSTRRTSSLPAFLLDVACMFFPLLLLLPVAENGGEFKKARRVLQEMALEVVQGARREMKSAEQQDEGDGAEQEEGRKRAGQRTDILSSLMRANANAKRQEEQDQERARNSKLWTRRTTLDKAMLSDEELTGQISTLMFAGHETTSVQLIWLLHALAQKPAIQTRLRDEIREAREKAGLRGVSDPVLPLRATSEDGEGGGEGKVPEREEGEAGQEGDGQGRELTYAEVEDLQYLDWVVQEGLRLMGPIHTTSRVSTVADVIPLSPSPPSSSSSTRPSQTHLRIPPGLCIILPLEALGRNREWWGDDADEFRPERWGEDAEGDEGKDGKVKGRGMKMNRRMGGMAFLMGPRGCIGNRFARTELKSLLSILINSLHFSPAPGSRVIKSRWLVSRPWDCETRTERCPLGVRRAG